MKNSHFVYASTQRNLANLSLLKSHDYAHVSEHEQGCFRIEDDFGDVDFEIKLDRNDY